MRRRLGWAFAVAALLANRWVLGILVSADGNIESGLSNALIIGLQLVLALVAWRLIRGGRLLPGAASSWVLMLGVIILGLVMGEVAARMLPEMEPAPPTYPGERANRVSPNFQASKTFGWLMQPEHSFEWTIDGNKRTYVSDKDGFRTYEDPTSRRDNLPNRIAFVGDSFTFGVGVAYEDTFPAVLESMTSSTSVAIKSYAQPSYGIDQMTETLRHLAVETKPKLIVVGFIDEDFDRSMTAFRAREEFNKPTFVLDNGALRPMNEGDQPSRPIRLMQQKSWLLAAWPHFSRTLAKRFPVGDWWKVNAALLDRARHAAEAANARVLFVRVPQRHHKAFSTLSIHMERSGAAYLDLAAKTHPEGKPLHFKTDDHINELGHRAVAEAIAEWIKGQSDLRQLITH